MKIKTFRAAFRWNRYRLIREHGYKEGIRRFREIPFKEAMQLWRKEGPGRLEIH